MSDNKLNVDQTMDDEIKVITEDDIMESLTKVSDLIMFIHTQCTNCDIITDSIETQIHKILGHIGGLKSCIKRGFDYKKYHYRLDVFYDRTRVYAYDIVTMFNRDNYPSEDEFLNELVKHNYISEDIKNHVYKVSVNKYKLIDNGYLNMNGADHVINIIKLPEEKCQ